MKENRPKIKTKDGLVKEIRAFQQDAQGRDVVSWMDEIGHIHLGTIGIACEWYSPTEEKRNEGMKVDVLQEAYKYRDAISAEMEPLIPQSISPESREYHLDGIVKGFLQACQQFKLIQPSPLPDKPEH